MPRIPRTTGRCPLVLALLLLFAALPAGASTFLDLDDPAYDVLSRLEAEGLIASGVLSIRPISRKEAVRLLAEAEARAGEQGAFAADLVRELRERLGPDELGAGASKPLDRVYGRFIDTDTVPQVRSYPGADRLADQPLNANNGGDLYADGSNWRIGLDSRLEDAGPFSLYLNPELRAADGSEQGVLRAGYGVIGFSWIDITLGKDAQWWGPGRHGALLLSDNAESLTMIRFSGPSPRTLPWLLKYLGPFQYSVFVSRLDAERSDFARPFFWGVRFAFKPHRLIEAGLAKTALLGGRGRPEGPRTWIDSLFAFHEHEQVNNPGDQRAGYDLKLTLPFRTQPVQLYWEQAGEENRRAFPRRPYKLANLYGIYLPRFAGMDRIELRGEYALNRVSGQDFVWYTHGTYTAGYTYKGMVLGHHMGTESRDLFGELVVRFPEKLASLAMSLERVEHDLSQAVREQDTEAVLRGALRLTDTLEVGAVQGFGRTRNAGAVPGATERSRLTALSATILF
jgi:hypothetical protein